jgi:hypothetical protein
VEQLGGAIMSDVTMVLAVQAVATVLLYLASLLIESIEDGAQDFDELHRAVAEAEAHT